jgi:hypothetical protein
MTTTKRPEAQQDGTVTLASGTVREARQYWFVDAPERITTFWYTPSGRKHWATADVAATFTPTPVPEDAVTETTPAPMPWAYDDRDGRTVTVLHDEEHAGQRVQVVKIEDVTALEKPDRTWLQVRTSRGWASADRTDADIAKLAARGRKRAELIAADDAIRAQVVRLVGSAPAAELVRAPAPAVGDVVYVHGMGRMRRGLVVKIGRTTVQVAYTTPSSEGRIYRAAVPAERLLTDPS